MKVSHELPLKLLNESGYYNDYEYALVHLLETHDEYARYYLEAKKRNRYIILDNSLHELGDSYPNKKLIKWVNKLTPNEFIVPDVWEDSNLSIRNAKEWTRVTLPKKTEKVVVVQAKSLEEAIECTQTYKDLGYKKIAFSYGASYYNNIFPSVNKDLGKALGRIYVINYLIKNDILTPYDRIHLLGCSVPQEFGWYNTVINVESIDTSNPVMAAIEGIKYGPGGLYSKPKASMNSHFTSELSDISLSLLDYNIQQFRKINNI